MNRDYSKTLIYKMSCKDPLVPDFYLGYTTFSLAYMSEMFNKRSKNDKKWPVCDFIRTHGGFENWIFERLDCKPCLNSHDARTELRRHFDADPPTLNKQIPTRTSNEYCKGEEQGITESIQRGTRGEDKTGPGRTIPEEQGETTYQEKGILFSQ